MTDAAAPDYHVLARKYRPERFAELVGQEALVRTLTNAIESGRLAHAFILTGVRGVGKTTTARIIARALNCIGVDGSGGPTPEPCGQCEHCRAIAEDRHMDVLEMDAASRTGVDDIRELIDGVRYAPTSARYKIYIIDEVHMLSKNAFNALLKTLEEPPPHVKFVFATTEVRKVPVTVLSRCQRFDLRRVEPEVLGEHLRGIADTEKAEVEAGALPLIVRAAEGSVRDGLSLLDQAIAHGAGKVEEEQVRSMLGLADRGQVLDLFEAVMAGEAAKALELLGAQYAAGADPTVVLQDMLELSHWLTRLKLAGDAAEDPTMAADARSRSKALAEKLSMPVLARAWQMLLKGLGEVRIAPAPLAAAEMALVRLAYAADLPTPAEVVAEIKGSAGPPRPGLSGDGGSAGVAATPPPEAPRYEGGAPTPTGRPQAALKAEPVRAEGPPLSAPMAERAPEPESFRSVVELAETRLEGVFAARLRQFVHLVKFEPGRIEFRPAEGAPADLAADLSAKLGQWSGRRWVVTLSQQPGAPTMAQKAARADAGLRAAVEAHPLVKAALETFPGARIRKIRELGPGADQITDDIHDRDPEDREDEA